MKKVEIFFIPFSTITYGENTIYIFVDFRIKRACRANYRGATFRLMRKMAKYLNPKRVEWVLFEKTKPICKIPRPKDWKGKNGFPLSRE